MCFHGEIRKIYLCRIYLLIIGFYLELWNLSQRTTKPTKWHVCPAKTQFSLGICSVWSESSLSTWRKLSLATFYLLSTQWGLWSDWADAHADPSLCWAHMLFCRFCHALAQIRLDIAFIFSSKEIIWMKCQVLVSVKDEEKYFKLLLYFRRLRDNKWIYWMLVSVQQSGPSCSKHC